MTWRQVKTTLKRNASIGPLLLLNKPQKKRLNQFMLREKKPEKIHSLAILIKGDEKRGISGIQQLIPLFEQALELDRHYIPTRYPNGVPFGKPFEFYTRKKAEECLECAREIIEACRSILDNM